MQKQHSLLSLNISAFSPKNKDTLIHNNTKIFKFRKFKNWCNYIFFIQIPSSSNVKLFQTLNNILYYQPKIRSQLYVGLAACPGLCPLSPMDCCVWTWLCLSSRQPGPCTSDRRWTHRRGQRRDDKAGPEDMSLLCPAWPLRPRGRCGSPWPKGWLPELQERQTQLRPRDLGAKHLTELCFKPCALIYPSIHPFTHSSVDLSIQPSIHPSLYSSISLLWFFPNTDKNMKTGSSLSELPEVLSPRL